MDVKAFFNMYSPCVQLPSAAIPSLILVLLPDNFTF